MSNREIRFQYMQTDDSIGVLYLNGGSTVPAHVVIASDARALNSLIGARVGTVLPLRWQRPGSNLALWIDDEALLATPPRPTNPLASALAGTPIHGDAACIAHDGDGDSTSIEFDDFIEIGRRLAEALCES